MPLDDNPAVFTAPAEEFVELRGKFGFVVDRFGTVHSGLVVVGTGGTNPLLTVRFNA